MNQAFQTTRHRARRRFLRGALATAGASLAACAAAQHKPERDTGHEAEVTPGEDLMQEHGLLERILLVYEEAARRIERGEAVDLSVIQRGAGIVRRFVEDYHEKNEESFVFPRLERAGRERDLVRVLLEQHQHGRTLTDGILRGSTGKASPELAQGLRSFCRMYRPHAAREETVLLPAFRQIIGERGYRDLGEQLEAEEQRLFGEGGFERTVAEVAALEAAFGIADLASFTSV